VAKAAFNKEVSFYQQIRLKMNAGTNKMLHLEAKP
jgi:hypothetical protein